MTLGCARSSLLLGLYLIVVCRLLSVEASPVAEPGLQGARASLVVVPGLRAQAQQLWHKGSVASQHMGSFWNNDRTHASYIGRQILYH